MRRPSSTSPFLEDDRVLPVLVGGARGRDAARAGGGRAGARARRVAGGGRGAARAAFRIPIPGYGISARRASAGRRTRAPLPLLEVLARNDPFQHVRLAAVDAIGVVGGDSAAGVLSALTESENPAVATAAVRALGAVNAASALEPLRRALSGPDAGRRAAAADALARWGREPAVALLRWTAAADSEPEVVRAAIAGLCRIGNLATPAAHAAIARARRGRQRSGPAHGRDRGAGRA